MKSNDPADEFVSMIDAHKGIIYKIVNTYCRHVEDRKDLAQEIILKLWKAFDRYDNRLTYSTWMYKIALNVAVSYYRIEKRRKKMTDPYPEDLFTLNELSLEKNEASAHLLFLNQCISELGELDKVLMLLYLEEKTYKEIADISGITETNVATKLSRIKKALKSKFSQNKNLMI